MGAETRGMEIMGVEMGTKKTVKTIPTGKSSISGSM